MKSCYVPYSGDTPLVVTINGHDLILVGLEPEVFEESSLLTYEDDLDIEVREYALDEMKLDEMKSESEDSESETEEQPEEDEEVDLLEELAPVIEELNAAEFQNLNVVGGDDGAPSPIQEVEGIPLGTEATKVLEQFAHRVALESGSGVVFVPSAASLDDVLTSLEGQLPWLQ